MGKPYLIVIGGATASGKTSAAIELCRRLDGEVVSCDSMQVYRGMDIGTAKPTKEEQDGIPHHMLDIINPDEKCTVTRFREEAVSCIADVIGRGKQPVLCGGTGLYIDAITRHMAFGEDSTPDSLREELKAAAEKEHGREWLHERLRRIDPESADRLHPNDTRRVIRAIEIYETTGHTMTEQMKLDREREGDFDIDLFALEWPRDQLYDRINRRVDLMMKQGLVDEVRGLMKAGLTADTTAMQALGYKEIVSALTGCCSMTEAVEQIKMGSRRYAKRQMTWFRRDERVRWISAANKNTDNIVDEMMKEIELHGKH